MCEYCIASSVEDAINILTAFHGNARLIAGGTDLMLDLRSGRKQALTLVDITRISELRQIQLKNGYVEIGAAVTFEAIRNFEYFKLHIPMLIEAARSVGAAGIQNKATLVGNIIQAMPAADGAIVALALDAEVMVVDPGNAVWIPVSTLFNAPGVSAIDPSRQILTHLRFKIPDGYWGAAWQRIGRRSALTLPILNCAVRVELLDGCFQHTTVALGPVASIPFRAKNTESYLDGKLVTQQNITEAGYIAQRESNPHDNPLRASRNYRLDIIPVILRRALEKAVERANLTELARD